MRWITIKKVTECPANYNTDYFIRYNEGRDKETGDTFKIKELFENGWNDVEYLDETPSPIQEGVELLDVYKKNMEGIYKIVMDMNVSEPHRTMIHDLCKKSFNGHRYDK